MERPIVVAGEALIDLVADGGADAPLRAHPGGGPFNVARTIARLGQPVTFLGALSDDAYGARLHAQLAADGVELGAVVATTRPTTLAVAQLAADGSAAYRFYTVATSASALTAPQALAALAPPPAALLVGGLALALEPIGGALEIAVEAIGADTLVALDPNCRPGAIADPAAYRARLTRILRRVDLLKASVEDLDYLFPGRAPLESARALLDAGATGPAAAVVTRGPEGAVLLTPGTTVEIPAAPAAVIDTIGAGDAFAGGLLAWWREHGLGRADLSDTAQLTAAARFAARVAAATCARAGASPPTRGQLPAAPA